MDVTGLKHARRACEPAYNCFDRNIDSLFNDRARPMTVFDTLNKKPRFRMRLDFRLFNRPVEEGKYTFKWIRIGSCRVFKARGLQRASTTPRFVIPSSGTRSDKTHGEPEQAQKHRERNCHPGRSYCRETLCVCEKIGRA